MRQGSPMRGARLGQRSWPDADRLTSSREVATRFSVEHGDHPSIPKLHGTATPPRSACPRSRGQWRPAVARRTPRNRRHARKPPSRSEINHPPSAGALAPWRQARSLHPGRSGHPGAKTGGHPLQRRGSSTSTPLLLRFNAAAPPLQRRCSSTSTPRPGARYLGGRSRRISSSNSSTRVLASCPSS
jgi:hypothetical protein